MKSLKDECLDNVANKLMWLSMIGIGWAWRDEQGSRFMNITAKTVVALIVLTVVLHIAQYFVRKKLSQIKDRK